MMPKAARKTPALKCESMLNDVRERLAANAPIDFETVCKAWGEKPESLCSDTELRGFFGVWAVLCFEWADAMIKEAQMRKEK